MEIKRFINGPFQVNSYLVYDGKTAVIIDPGHDSGRLISFIRENSLEPKALLLTHAHIDHVAGIADVEAAFPGINTYLHDDDRELLAQVNMQARMFSLPELKPIVITHHLSDGEKLQFDGLTFDCLLTPGHSMGSVCFHSGNAVFSGDLVFLESVGRTDLFGGSHSELKKSIREKIFTLPKETVLYPGHGDSTTVGHEMKHNPYM